MPYAGELPLALALLALVGLGASPSVALVHGLRDFARAAWTSKLAYADALAALRDLGGSLLLLLCVPALAALVGVVVQRAPTLRLFVAAGGADGRDEQSGRPARGRIAHNLLAVVKALLLAASLGILLFDSAAGWLESYARSSSQLLALAERTVPAMLVRAAWACLAIAGLELGAQHFERLRRLRMTRAQVQDEQRELLGNPQLLAERRARGQLPARLAPQLRAANLAQLEAATLLITGRSAVVALRYDDAQGVPTVLLAAEGALAVELLQRAYTLGLPLANDELLALALLRVPAGSNVPLELHAQVAQHIASAARTYSVALPIRIA